MENNNGFLRNHADAIAIIGVNIAIAAILITMWVAQSSRIDCVNSRMDNVYNVILEMIKK